MSFITIREQGERRVIRLSEVTVIGRGGSCDIVLKDPLASKRHAEIREENGRFLLRDLQSTNGTLISGQKIEEEISLQDGDEMMIGDAGLLFTRAAPAGEPAAQPKALTGPAEVAAIDAPPAHPAPHGTLVVPVERFGLRAPEFVATTIRAAPASAADFGVWLRSLYSLLREASACESEDELLSTATRIMSEALPSVKVRVLFEVAPGGGQRPKEVPRAADSNEALAAEFIPWIDPARQKGRESRILDPGLTQSRARLVAYARDQGVAVLSRDVEEDERAHRRHGKAESSRPSKAPSDDRERFSLIVAPLLTGRSILGFLTVERLYRPFQAGKRISGPFAEAHLEFVAAAAYPLATLLSNLRRRQTVMVENERLRKSTAGKYEIIGHAKSVRNVHAVIERVARTDAPVLILGESGTGKELVARNIHALSTRRSGPFEAINCGALPENLVESELFGHARGAFTGAVANRMGCFEVASGGTLFLDEIGELPLTVQTRLLRVLEDGKVTRVGESRLRDVDCRIVSATNRNIAAEVQAGRFRTDLYYRLRVMDVTLPPLRERIEDLAALCEHLLQPFGYGGHGGGGFRIHPEVFELFKKYRWPGNIRELRNTLERMAVMSRPQPGESTRASVTQLTVNDVPLDIRRAVEIGPILTDSGRMPAVSAEPASIIVTPPRGAGSGAAPSAAGFAVPSGQIRSLEQLQVEYARWVLEHFNGNKTKAAKALGIQRSTLYAWTEWEKGE